MVSKTSFTLETGSARAQRAVAELLSEVLYTSANFKHRIIDSIVGAPPHGCEVSLVRREPFAWDGPEELWIDGALIGSFSWTTERINGAFRFTFTFSPPEVP